MVILLLHIVVKKIHLVTFGSGLMVSMFITRMKVLFILLTMDSRMIQMQHHILMQESQFVVQMVMFLLLLTMKTLIGYSLQVKFLEIVHFQLVTIFGRTKHIMATRSLYWAVIGLMVLMRAVSVGVWIMLRVIVVVISAVACCMYLMVLMHLLLNRTKNH